MYRYSNGQIRLSNFKQSMGMNLKEENRWVKRASLIPWNDSDNSIFYSHSAFYNWKKADDGHLYPTSSPIVSCRCIVSA